MSTKKTGTEVVTAKPQSLVTVAAQFGVISEDLNELARIGADSMSRAMFEITRAGLAFLRAQELLSLGDFGNDTTVPERSGTEGFIAWIDENGLSNQRVYESMRIAKFVTQLPQKQRDDVLSLGKVKVTLLASLPQEIIDQAAESGNDLIGKADMMTVAQFKEEIATLRRREVNYEAQLEIAQGKINHLSQAKQRLSTFELKTEELRAECMALQLEAELPFNALRKLFEQALNDASGSPEARLRVEQIWISAHCAAATAFDALNTLRVMADEFPNGLDLPERSQSQHILTPGEAADWLLTKPLLENRYEAQRALREEKRALEKPKGPGRPKGAKNKAGD